MIMMKIKLTITGTAESIPAAVEQINDFCHQAGMGSDECFRIQVILVEALNNIVEHALAELPGSTIEIFCHTDEQNLVITTIDHGKPFSASEVHPMPDSLAESGRGWPIIDQWADQVKQFRDDNANHLNITLSRKMHV